MCKIETVKLRSIEPEDVDLIYEWENNPYNWFISETYQLYSKFMLELFVREARDYDMTISKQLRQMIDILEDGVVKTIGTLDLFEYNPIHRRAGIGIFVSEKYRGKGVGTKALFQMVQYARDILNLHQLHCTIAVTNNVSLALFQNAGFKITGTNKDWLIRAEKPTDVYFLQLLLQTK